MGVQSGREWRDASARETLRAKWRRESEASTQPARTPPPAARGAPPPPCSRGSRAGVLVPRLSGICSFRLGGVKGIGEEGAYDFRDALWLLYPDASWEL